MQLYEWLVEGKRTAPAVGKSKSKSKQVDEETERTEPHYKTDSDVRALASFIRWFNFARPIPHPNFARAR